jgi:hypothetical protein
MPPDLAEHLHKRGIRTASQLLCECRSRSHSDKELVTSLGAGLPSREEVRSFSSQLATGDDDLSAAALENAMLGMLTEPCMRRVQSWKANPAPGERHLDASDERGATRHRFVAHLRPDLVAEV